MKTVNYLSILFTCTCLLFSACKKENTTVSKTPKADVVLSVTNTDGTVSVNKGQTISVTLGNPGDGGFSLDPAIYTTTILSLTSHTHAAAPSTTANGQPIDGNAGTDTWLFTAKQTGQTGITITASRPNGAETNQLFNNTVTVK